MVVNRTFPGIYLTTTEGKRQAFSGFEPGDALVAVQPILGYCHEAGHLTVYVNGTMPLAMRSALEDGHTAAETWLVEPLPQGIREIDLDDCRREFFIQKAA